MAPRLTFDLYMHIYTCVMHYTHTHTKMHLHTFKYIHRHTNIQREKVERRGIRKMDLLHTSWFRVTRLLS